MVSQSQNSVAQAEQRRVRELTELFRSRFQVRNFFFVRVPGRVNLIGEHTDYNGYPVLPIAIERDILLCASPADDGRIVVGNRDRRYPEREFSVADPIAPFPTGDWGNYVKAAVYALRDRVKGSPSGLRLLCDGAIPAAAGLSSSSALLVAAALAFNRVHSIDLSRLELAELLAEAEHFVGTRGGGMDQAIVLLGRPDHALKIDFSPLAADAVPLPPDYAIVVCHSGVRAAKTEAVRRAYNLRAAECRLAAVLLSAALGRKESCPVLAQLDPRNSTVSRTVYSRALSGILSLAPLGFGEICERLQRSEQNVLEQVLHQDEPEPLYQPARRIRHVLSEAARVRRAARVLRSGAVSRFGALMYASHRSCQKWFEISTPELDVLVDLARELGATGARLTGAGFGGCTVNLVRREEIKPFIERLRHRYFRTYLPSARPDLLSGGEDVEELIFATRAADGARLFTP